MTLSTKPFENTVRQEENASYQNLFFSHYAFYPSYKLVSTLRVTFISSTANVFNLDKSKNCVCTVNDKQQ